MILLIKSGWMASISYTEFRSIEMNATIGPPTRKKNRIRKSIVCSQKFVEFMTHLLDKQMRCGTSRCCAMHHQRRQCHGSGFGIDTNYAFVIRPLDPIQCDWLLFTIYALNCWNIKRLTKRLHQSNDWYEYHLSPLNHLRCSSPNSPAISSPHQQIRSHSDYYCS